MRALRYRALRPGARARERALPSIRQFFSVYEYTAQQRWTQGTTYCVSSYEVRDACRRRAINCTAHDLAQNLAQGERVNSAIAASAVAICFVALSMPTASQR